MNTNMQTLISLQQTTAATQALQLVGSTVTLNGNRDSFECHRQPRVVELERIRWGHRSDHNHQLVGSDRLHWHHDAQCRQPVVQLERSRQ